MIQQLSNKINKIERLLSDSKSDNVVFLNIEEASDFLKVKKSTLYQKTHLKTIPFYKTGKKVLFKKSDLVHYIEKTKVEER